MGTYKELHKRDMGLIKKGYEQINCLTFSDNPSIECPKGFPRPKGYNGWKWRKAIKRFLIMDNLAIELLKNKQFIIVKGLGYWKDLTNIVYEVWVRKKK